MVAMGAVDAGKAMRQDTALQVLFHFFAGHEPADAHFLSGPGGVRPARG